MNFLTGFVPYKQTTLSASKSTTRMAQGFKASAGSQQLASRPDRPVPGRLLPIPAPRCYLHDVVERGSGGWEAAAAAPPHMEDVKHAYASSSQHEVPVHQTQAVMRQQQQHVSVADEFLHAQLQCMSLLHHASYCMAGATLPIYPYQPALPPLHTASATQTTLSRTLRLDTSVVVLASGSRLLSLLLASVIGVAAWAVRPYHALAHAHTSVAAAALDAVFSVPAIALALALAVAGACACVCAAVLARTAQAAPSLLHGA